MLGFSIPKILVLVLIVWFVWWIFKFVNRSRKVGQKNEKSQNIESSDDNKLDLEACSFCGDYVPLSAVSCGEDKCPFPIK